MSQEQLMAAWPYLALVLPFLLGLIVKLAQAHLRGEVQMAVGAAYRNAIHCAVGWQEEGIAWLRGAKGVQLRRELACAAYDALPARLGPVPIGILKGFVSRERWVALVEQGFAEMVELAEKLEYPLEIEVELEPA